MKPLPVALAAIAVAIVYLLSPLTVWFAVGIVPIVALSTRGLDGEERRWVVRLAVIAIALRVAVILGLFLTTDHASVPFGSFFGDEEYFIRRSLWLRNLSLGIPLHPFDLEYAFEPHGSSRYLYLLALVQLLVGPAPYGLHLLGVIFYMLAVLLLYRLVRATLGRMPALFGLSVLLFLPSLFAWSVSVLKEPLFVLINALGLVVAVKLVRGSCWRTRGLALAGIIVFAALLESIRQAGAAFALLGILTGLAIAFIAMRPRFLLAALLATPILVGAVLSRPDVQLKAYAVLQSAARQHWGMVVVSRGYPYRLLDDRFYPDVNEISDLRLPETLRFLVRAVLAYVTVPLPWMAASRAAVAYLPEQVVWYALAALAFAGALFGFRRDALVTGLLLGHVLVAAAAAAFIDGNVGTLVRHRGLALPFLVWLSAVGLCDLVAIATRPPEPSIKTSNTLATPDLAMRSA